MVAAPAARAGEAVRALIVGAGPAGDGVAAGLRDAGFDGEITLAGAELEPPYERPHLSKGYLLGTVPRERLALRPLDQYRSLGVELALGERAVELNVERRTVTMESGRSLGWDVICLATGSAPRRLPGLGAALDLRELPDADRLRAVLAAGGHLDIVGGGFIGCEVAAAAVKRGMSVRILEAGPQPMAWLGGALGGYVASLHRAHGVEVQTGVTLLPELPGPVVAGVGSEPRTEIARAAGLEVDRGIVVDALGRTSAPGVFAAGDVTRFESPLYETRIRVEHFQTSQRQGFAVGRAMAGRQEPYQEAPWFWSDQYDLNLQYAGAPGVPCDGEVCRGEAGRPPFTVFRLQGSRLVAAIGFNDHHSVARARRIIERRAEVSRDRLADPGFDLRRALS